MLKILRNLEFFAFFEIFLMLFYGVRHCTDSQWMSLKNLGTAVNIIVSADNGPGIQGSYHQRIFKPCIQELARSGVPILGYKKGCEKAIKNGNFFN